MENQSSVLGDGYRYPGRLIATTHQRRHAQMVTIRKLLILTAAVALLCTGFVAISAHPERSMLLLAMGGSALFLAVFGSVSRPLRSAAFSLLGALALSVCFTILFNLRSQVAANARDPVLQVDYLLGSILGGTTGFVATLPFLLVAWGMSRRKRQLLSDSRG